MISFPLSNRITAVQSLVIPAGVERIQKLCFVPTLRVSSLFTSVRKPIYTNPKDCQLTPGVERSDTPGLRSDTAFDPGGVADYLML